jgi:DNA-binding PadR family transcriptional regulator
MTGYDRRLLSTRLQQIWYAPPTQIYPTLRKMQREGSCARRGRFSVTDRIGSGPSPPPDAPS